MPKSSYAVHLEAYGHLADTVAREAAFAQAGQAAAQLRLGLRSAYGEKSLKLITFGMRPHRAAWLPKK